MFAMEVYQINWLKSRNQDTSDFNVNLYIFIYFFYSGNGGIQGFFISWNNFKDIIKWYLYKTALMWSKVLFRLNWIFYICFKCEILKSLRYKKEVNHISPHGRSIWDRIFSWNTTWILCGFVVKIKRADNLCIYSISIYSCMKWNYEMVAKSGIVKKQQRKCLWIETKTKRCWKIL